MAHTRIRSGSATERTYHHDIAAFSLRPKGVEEREAATIEI